jgi:hypothetical protein
MPTTFLKDILDHMYPWFYNAAGVVIVLALGTFFYFTFYGMNKFANAIKSVVHRDDRIKELQEKVDLFKDRSTNNEIIASQLSSVITKMTPFIESLNNLRTIDGYEHRISESLNLIHKVLESLSLDIKNKAGENHRCGIWMPDQDYLRLYFTSSGFPRTYVNNRILHRDRTIAGKCFRKKKTIHLDDVTLDNDWEISPEGKSNYKSLICIPIGVTGVLTIDGIKPMSQESVKLSELYCSVIEGALQEYFRAFNEKLSEGLVMEDQVV